MTININVNKVINWKEYPKTRQKQFINTLKSQNSMKGQEAIVQSAWYDVLNYSFAEPNKGYATHIEKILGTDGLLFVRDISVDLSLITEFKDDVPLDKKIYQERILAQVIFYLKNIQKHIKEGNKLQVEMPNVVLAADANQVFVINARILYPYLDLDIDWNKAPRYAYDNMEPQLMFDKLNNDNNINPYIYDIRSKDFNLNDVLELVVDLASTENESELQKISVNQANIRSVYDEFLRLVTQDKTKVDSNQELVSLFIDALTHHEQFFIRNNTVNFLKDNGSYKQYRVNGRNWYAFFSRFDTNYTADEIKDITAVGDVLLEETNRRFSGEYWTPTIWANEAINTITSVLGNDWRDKYYVWDAAAGSKNLTRDFKFKHLFSSTLYDDELELGKMYNTNNVAFQYDFLNDDVCLTPDSKNTKLQKYASELFDALCNDKPIVFFTNPPYGTAGDLRRDKEHKKAGVANNKIHDIMMKDKMGSASQQLYIQFFYRVLKIKEYFHLSNVVIAYFSNVQFLSGGKFFNKFSNKLFEQFSYQKGFLLNAGEFSDTSSSWGIGFTILTSNKNNVTDSNKKFLLEVKETDMNGIVNVENHVIDDLSQSDFLSNWVREAIPKNLEYLNKDTYPTFNGPFKVKETSKHNPPRMPKHFLGYAWNKGNNVEKSEGETALFSATWRDGNGFPIIEEDFERVMLNFAIRKATVRSWINNKDNYHKPDNDFIGTDEYNQLVYDSVVYGLFNQYSYQTSLKDVKYKGQIYNVKNEFFWLSKDQILKLANKFAYSDMAFDIENSNERYVYLWLNNHEKYANDETKEVLKYALDIINNTFSERQLINDDYPEYNLMQWDAGWEQIRKLINNGHKCDIYNCQFKNAYQKLNDKINDDIYKYNFLFK